MITRMIAQATMIIKLHAEILWNLQLFKMAIPDIYLKKQEPDVIPLQDIFKAYCEMDPISSEYDSQLLPLTQSDKWLISARILDMVTLTTTNTGLAFFKFRKRALSYEEYLLYLEDLAKIGNLDFEEMKKKLQASGMPRKTA